MVDLISSALTSYSSTLLVRFILIPNDRDSTGSYFNRLENRRMVV